MKNKGLFLFLSLFALVSCGTRLTDPKIPQLTEFADENLNRAIRVSEQKKAELKEEIYNIFMEAYIPTVMDGSTIEYSKEYAIENGFYAPSYYDLDNSYLEANIIGYTIAIQEVNGEYVKNGSYFEFVGESVFTDDYCAYMCEYGVSNIFSWEILDFVKMMTRPQQDVSVSVGGINISQTSGEQKFYSNLVCTNDDGNGNFSVSITGDISYVVTQTLSISFGGEESSISYDATITTDKVDLVYKDHKVSEILVHTSVVEDAVYDENNNLLVDSYSYEYVMYSTYQYNVGEDVFTPTYLA